MREGKGAIVLVADTRSSRNYQKEIPSLRQVFLRIGKRVPTASPKAAACPSTYIIGRIPIQLTLRFLTQARDYPPYHSQPFLLAPSWRVIGSGAQGYPPAAPDERSPPQQLGARSPPDIPRQTSAHIIGRTPIQQRWILQSEYRQPRPQRIHQGNSTLPGDVRTLLKTAPQGLQESGDRKILPERGYHGCFSKNSENQLSTYQKVCENNSLH